MDINRLCKGCFRELHEAGQICPFCGFDEKKYEAERNPEVLPLNTILRGAFIVGKCLGKGGFGITYICWHINLETVVAIKEFYPSGIVYRNIDSSSGYDSSSVSLTGSGSKEIYQKALQSFLKEARILVTLNLPGIVDVHDCFEENNTVYLVMDYIQGGDLKAYINNRGGKISEEETLKLLHPVIESLQEVHQQNIIHRDISPDNILLNKKGEVILVDFGAARNVTAQVAGEQGKSMTVVLKPGYAPMEQYNVHGNQGPWTDVYALCATMYRMMTGTVLNDPGTRNNTDDDEQIIRQNLKNNQVSDHTTDVLIKGLELRVKDRYQSMQELENALYSEGSKTPVVKNRQPAEAQKSSGSQKKPAVASKPSGNGKKKWIGIISIAALLIIVAVLGVLSVRKSNKTYTLTVKGGRIQGTDSSTGNFREGEQIAVEPEEREHYAFTGWTVSNDNVITQTIGETLRFAMPAEPFTVTAEYEEVTYSVEVKGGSFPDGKTNGSFREGTEITVRAEKKEGFDFTGWQIEQGNVTFEDADAEETSFTMGKEDAVVSAGFVQKTYVLTVNGGTIQGIGSSTGGFHEGEQITVEPEEREHYVFTGWTVSDENVIIQPMNNALRFAMPAEEFTVTAEYKKAEHTLSVENGTISGGESTGRFHEGDQITVVPEKKEGYKFIGWTVSDETVEIQFDGDNLKITMPLEDITVTAGFEEIEPELLTEEEINCKVGDIITFGSYEQDNDLSDGKEPIEWLVLDKQGSKMLVISKYVLDSKSYSDRDHGWGMCDLRPWLNREFYNEAFSEAARKHIEETIVSTEKREHYYLDGQYDTRDKVFLLSASEAENFFEDDDARICYSTEYALARVALAEKETGICSWWLRTPGESAFNMAYIDDEGRLRANGAYHNSKGYGVRPALWINAEETDATEDVDGVNIGDYYTFGNYEQDNNTSNGSEPIEWLILDKQGSKVLVISKYGLDTRSYDDGWGKVTWEMCGLREWLNGEFYNKAFSAAEREQIEETVVRSENKEEYGSEAGSDTMDKIFLLSVSEAEIFFELNDDRICYPTEYALAKGAGIEELMNKGWGCEWWLRSPIDPSWAAGDVTEYGWVSSYSNPFYDFDFCVRPALWINLKS